MNITSHKKIWFTNLLLGIICTLVLSCTSGNGILDPNGEIQLIEDLSSTIIIPKLNEFTNASASLNSTIAALAEDPSEANLLLAQHAWEEAQDSWQITDSFQFGPVKELYLLNKINYWPKVPAYIENAINETDTITEDYVQQLGVANKGLPVLEYLLFDHVNGNSAILTLLQSSEKRRTYTALIASELNEIASTLAQAWREDGDDYSSELAYSSDGLSMIVNQMVFSLENIKNNKIGTPLGKNSKTGTPVPNEVESQQSTYSLTNLYNNIQSLNTLFNGYSGSVNGNGLDDYINYRGFSDISNEINTQIDIILTRIDTIEAPLWEAVTEDSSTVEGLYDDMTELIRLVKIDLATAINTTIYFNDSDGD